MKFLLASLLVIGYTWLNDWAWALYIRRVAKGAAVRAGVWASVIYTSGIVLTLQAINDHRLIAVAAVATFLGTWFTVRRDHNADK